MSVTTIAHLMSQHEQLEHASDSPLLDCQILMACAISQSREWLYAHNEYRLNEDELLRFAGFIEQRQSGVPVAYITGTKAFWNHTLEVSPATLVPRPETELLVETLLSRFSNEPLTVADLGTGCGAIAVSIAAERPNWDVIGVDLSKAALCIASRNGCGLGNVRWITASWCKHFSNNSIDVIVSNPPYVRQGDDHLHNLTHEPADALVGGDDGLLHIREIVKDGYHCLKKGGWILIEHAPDQGWEVSQLLRAAGFTKIESLKDIEMRPRAAFAQR